MDSSTYSNFPPTGSPRPTAAGVFVLLKDLPPSMVATSDLKHSDYGHFLEQPHPEQDRTRPRYPDHDLFPGRRRRRPEQDLFLERRRRPEHDILPGRR